MAYYRIVIPYGLPSAEKMGPPLRFSAGLGCNSPMEARQRGLTELREMALALGMSQALQLREEGVFVEEIENRTPSVLETAAFEYAPGRYCLALRGPLESATALQLDKEIYGLQRQGTKSLVIDLGSVHPLGSAGLGVLLNLNDRLDVRLVRVPLKARKMMQLLGLDANLQIHNSFQEAMDSL